MECLSNPNSRNAPASLLLSLCAASTSALLRGRRWVGRGNNHANRISCSRHNEVTLPHLTCCRVRKEDETSDTVIVIGERDEHRARAQSQSTSTSASASTSKRTKTSQVPSQYPALMELGTKERIYGIHGNRRNHEHRSTRARDTNPSPYKCSRPKEGIRI